MASKGLRAIFYHGMRKVEAGYTPTHTSEPLLTLTLVSYFCFYALVETKCINHSYLNASTGFLVAARQLCQLTVSKAIPSAITPAKAKIHQLNSVLYAKPCSHLCMPNQAIGVAIRKERDTNITKSLLSNLIASDTLAPLILRIPISLVLLTQT